MNTSLIQDTTTKLQYVEAPLNYLSEETKNPAAYMYTPPLRHSCPIRTVRRSYTTHFQRTRVARPPVVGPARLSVDPPRDPSEEFLR